MVMVAMFASASIAVAQSSPNGSETWQPSDYIAIGAFVVSAMSLGVSFVSLRQKKYETQRTLREQLTKVIGDINTVFEKWDTLRDENATRRSELDAARRRSFLKGQQMPLARQAAYLMDQLVKQSPQLVSDIEYITVADAFKQTNDYPQADAYYEKAIEASQGRPYYMAMNVRAYGSSLFDQGRIDEARIKYKDSTKLLPLDSDVNRWAVAETYQRWAVAEFEASFPKEAKKHFERARTEFEKLENPGRKKQALAMLKKVEDSTYGRIEELDQAAPSRPAR
jgi:tetratricopeptide (TPR) repeat protein